MAGVESPPWREPSPRDFAALDAVVAAGLLSRTQAVQAIASARAIRSPLPDVLGASHGITGHVWAKHSAAASGLPLADLLNAPPDPDLVCADDSTLYLRHLFVPWRRDASGRIVVAARDPDDPAIPEAMERRMPGAPIAFAITGKFDVIWGVQRLFDTAISEEAREMLFRRHPELSAKTTIAPSQRLAFLGLAAAIGLGLSFAPWATLLALSGLTSLLYATLFLFRAMLTLIGGGRRSDISVAPAELAGLKDNELPVFTVLVPLYAEAAVLPVVVDSIRRLDYPRAKLDVKLVLEAGDHETITAAKALGAEDFFEIIRVPESYPKTKPKACNYAFRFARGEYTVVFDAEDIPEPDQLRKVVALFKAARPRIACVQARLNYFNANDNFLTRMFTLEYSHWFDYLLPGLHRLNIPIPLGGTSNHFRTKVLQELGGWDPYNVTEDADLGIRLTEAGYRVAVVNSTTFEEATSRLPSWINQRSRWIKGYMQTWLVHMRHPVTLYRRLGFVGFMGFHLFIGFPPFTALINPLLWATFVLSLLIGPARVAAFFPAPILILALFDLLIGNAMSVYFNLIAVAKRRWFGLLPWGVLTPFYWVLHSVAAYKALAQLIRSPHYWEKTPHGASARTKKAVAALALGRPAVETAPV